MLICDWLTATRRLTHWATVDQRRRRVTHYRRKMILHHSPAFFVWSLFDVWMIHSYRTPVTASYGCKITYWNSIFAEWTSVNVTLYFTILPCHLTKLAYIIRHEVKQKIQIQWNVRCDLEHDSYLLILRDMSPILTSIFSLLYTIKQKI